MSVEEKILVLGMGNPILTDDGVGLRLVDDLRESFPLPGVEYHTASAGGLEILEGIQGYDAVVMVDGIRTRGGVPGTVYRFPLGALPHTSHVSSLHAVGLPSAIALGRRIGLALPEAIQVIAIEIVEDLVACERFTPQIEDRYGGILQEVGTWIEEFVKERKVESRCTRAPSRRG
jgi:hydrogenase maturation protease